MERVLCCFSQMYRHIFWFGERWLKGLLELCTQHSEPTLRFGQALAVTTGGGGAVATG
jgi:hypothetical protein